MAWAVPDMCDQIPVLADTFWFTRYQLFEQITEGVYHVDVLFFVVAADIVGLPHFAFSCHFVEGAGMVFHVEPVTYLGTLAVHR